jgi:hypothetical protein
MTRMVKTLALAVLLLVASSAAAAPVDWNAVAAEQTVVILTREADGAPRETTVWLVVVDGQGYIRTGDTHWHGNIVREPQIGVRIAGADYPVKAEHVTDPALRAKIQAAYAEKYGYSNTFVGWFGNPDKAQILALVPREAAPPAP